MTKLSELELKMKGKTRHCVFTSARQKPKPLLTRKLFSFIKRHDIIENNQRFLST